MTQDTLTVTALYKQLRDKFKNPDHFKKYVKGEKPVIQIWKLFARHIPLTEQITALAATPNRPVVNVYIGTPNRIKALAEAQAIKLSSKKLKSIVFDCSLNAKNFTCFETHETRNDLFALVLQMQKQILKRKLKIYLA